MKITVKEIAEYIIDSPALMMIHRVLLTIK